MSSSLLRQHRHQMHLDILNAVKDLLISDLGPDASTGISIKFLT